jgi:hypothetical protein
LKQSNNRLLLSSDGSKPNKLLDNRSTQPPFHSLSSKNQPHPGWPSACRQSSKVKMSQEPNTVNPKLSGFNKVDRILSAQNYVAGDQTQSEPYLSAAEIRILLREARGRGMSIESLLAMAELGEIPAYRDTSRKTRWPGVHPIVFLWSEVRPVLLGRGRGTGRIVRIEPAKVKR